ncbi:hypothetical protein FQA39_LY16546 [Lamprigera yunnana]|nr:hypothetical protein FQA39_LY16546 [Lamprigera yunnana]
MNMKILLALLSIVFSVCWCQDFAFPNEEREKSGQTPTRFTEKRMPLFVPGACPPNQLYYPGDQEHDWICDCGPGFIYYPPKDGCFKAYMQGPCKNHEQLILPKNSVIPECVTNPCRKDGFVMYNKMCSELNVPGGPCGPAKLGGGVLGVNVTSLKIECLKTDGESLSLINFPPNCPPGSKRGISHCRQEYRKK